LIVTHNMQQAARASDYTAMMYQGRVIEYGKTEQIFSNPKEKQTQEYLFSGFVHCLYTISHSIDSWKTPRFHRCRANTSNGKGIALTQLPALTCRKPRFFSRQTR